jgi:hypothetical protein
MTRLLASLIALRVKEKNPILFGSNPSAIFSSNIFKSVSVFPVPDFQRF